MSQRCLIIEDDLRMSQEVKETIASNFPQLELLPLAHSVQDAETIIAQHQPDLVISDINLGEDEVFTLFQSYETIPFKIIFITSYSKYAVQAFKFSALDFLEKPFDDDALVEAVSRAIESINLDQYNEQLKTFFHNFNPQQKKKKLVLKNLEAIHIVETDDILYVKSDSNYSEFHVNDGRKLVVSKALKLYDEQLRHLSFFRSHQSYLINLQYAKTFHKQDSMLELVNGEQVPVAGTKAGALLTKLETL